MNKKNLTDTLKTGIETLVAVEKQINADIDNKELENKKASKQSSKTEVERRLTTLRIIARLLEDKMTDTDTAWLEDHLCKYNVGASNGLIWYEGIKYNDFMKENKTMTHTKMTKKGFVEKDGVIVKEVKNDKTRPV